MTENNVAVLKPRLPQHGDLWKRHGANHMVIINGSFRMKTEAGYIKCLRYRADRAVFHAEESVFMREHVLVKAKGRQTDIRSII